MTTKITPRTRQLFDELAELVKAHPELRDRTAEYFRGGTMSKDDRRAVRMPAALIDQVDALLPRLKQHPSYLAASPSVSRHAVLRLVVTLGIEDLSRRLDADDARLALAEKDRGALDKLGDRAQI